MTRQELIRRLSEGDDSPEIAKEALERLAEDFDLRLVDLLEQIHQRPLHQLYALFLGYNQDDQLDWHTGCNFLATYLAATTSTEAPRIYHIFAAMTVASALFGTRVWVDLGFAKVYPPIATILVGPSGARKSSAISLASKLVLQAEETNKVIVIRDRFTPEGVAETLHAGAKALFISSELSATFSKAKYLEGLIPTITRMLDQEGFEFLTKSSGRVRIRNVAFAFLGASTKDWIIEEMPSSALSGGFLGRFLIPCAASPSKVVFKSPPIESRLISLGEQLAAFAERVGGELLLAPAAESLLEKWYVASRAKEVTVAEAYYQRKLIHIVKLAMLLALCSERRVISKADVEEALGLLKIIEPEMVSILLELGGSVTYRDLAVLVKIIGHGQHDVRAISSVLVPRIGTKRYNEMMAAANSMGIIMRDGYMVQIDRSRIPPFMRRVLHGLEQRARAREQTHSPAEEA